LCHFDVLVIADADALSRFGEAYQFVSAPDRLSAQLRLKACFGGQEPAARDERRDGLPGELEIGQRRGGVGGCCGAGVSDAPPEVELPAQGDRPALNP
jgi:hypothetical protein